MLTDTNTIRTYFMKLGLEPEIADLYLALHTYGPQSISELSRNARVERTRIYRLIDNLLASNLIEVEAHYKRGIIKAAPITNLHILINEKEQELKSLQEELGLIEQVLATNSLSSPATRVQFYHGPEGIKQMLWNELRTKSEIVSYCYQVLDIPTGRSFMHRWREEFEGRGLKMRLLASDEFAASWQQVPHRGDKPSDGRIEGITYHYLAPEHFAITHTCEIYDDTVSYYNWRDHEIFGFEIHNKDIAEAQRHFFELLWAKSRPETRF